MSAHYCVMSPCPACNAAKTLPPFAATRPAEGTPKQPRNYPLPNVPVAPALWTDSIQAVINQEQVVLDMLAEFQRERLERNPGWHRPVGVPF